MKLLRIFKFNANRLKLPGRFNKTTGLIFVITFVAIGSILLFTTRAAGPFASVEPEAGTLSRSDLAINDSTASGGKTVQFGSGTVTPPTGAICGTISAGSNGYAGDYTKLGYKGNVASLPTFASKYPDSWRSDNQAAEPYQKTGQTFSDFKIGVGSIHPASNNLTFNNFVIDPGSALYPIFIKDIPGNIPADTITVTNATVAYRNGSDTSGYRNYIGSSNVTFRNLDLSGTHDGFSITENISNVLIENVCVRDLTTTATLAHNDGAEIYVGKNITLRNVILDNSTLDESQSNSAINFTDEGGDIDNVLLENVTLSTVKGCTIYIRGDGDGNVGSGSFDQTKITNLRFRNVHIARWGTRGGNECRYSYANAVGAIVEWTNVTGPDGQQLPMPQSICTDRESRSIPCP